MDHAFFEELEARIPKTGVRTRFAPSPTGYMHVGNLRTALYAWLIARKAGGAFLLRIEDTDQRRLVPGAVELIYKTLSDCGLTHDEGPDVGGPVGPYVQSERRALYGRYADLLIQRGGAVRCEEAGSSIVRQRIPKEGETSFHDEVFGDITLANDSLDEGVLLKSDGLPTYNFANVVDDHLMGVTHVVRGAEYLSSTPKYNLLYESFGWTPPKYVHCASVMRDATHKLSKRAGDPTYEDLLTAGYLPEAIVNYVALLGWSPGGERELFTLSELTEVFDISGISKSPAIFDLEKLKYFNSATIRGLPPADFARRAEPYIRAAVKNPAYDPDKLAKLLQPRCETLTDIPEKLDFFDALPDYDVALFVHKKSKSDAESSLALLRAALPVLENLERWDNQSVLDALTALAERLGVKNAALLWPVRIALAGRAVTPGGATEIAEILGRAETLRRLALGIEKLEAQQRP